MHGMPGDIFAAVIWDVAVCACRLGSVFIAQHRSQSSQQRALSKRSPDPSAVQSRGVSAAACCRDRIPGLYRRGTGRTAGHWLIASLPAKCDAIAHGEQERRRYRGPVADHPHGVLGKQITLTPRSRLLSDSTQRGMASFSSDTSADGWTTASSISSRWTARGRMVVGGEC